MVRNPDDVNPEQIAEQLKKFGTFKNWRAGDLHELASRVNVHDLEAGDTVQEARGAGDYLYLLASGQVRESATDEQGRVWWERTYREGEAFSRQATYDQIYHETDVWAITPVRLYVLDPANLAWALGRQPGLWNALVREALAARMRGLPLLATLTDEQIRRLATITRAVEVPAGTVVCEPAASDADANFWFIDWGQVSVSEQTDAGPHTITAGNFFHNRPAALGSIVPVSGQALTRARLLRVPAADMLVLIHSNPGVQKRLQPPPIERFLLYVEQFRALRPDQIAALATITSWEFYPASQTVTQQGVRGSSLRILHRGAAVVRATDDQGRERPRDYLAPSAYYGISSLFRQDRHHTTVRAVRPDKVGTSGAHFTSTAVENDPAQADEPGATWFRIRYDDLVYLIEENREEWAGTVLLQTVKLERHPYRKYPWQEEDEVLLFDGRRHIIVLIRSLLIPLLLLIIEGGIFWSANWFGMLLPSAAETFVVLITVLPFVVWYVVDYFNDYFVVTTLRVTAREQVVLVYESRTEAPLDQVQDTTVFTGLLGTIFGFGDLIIKTAGNVARVTFDRVPRPHRIQQLISEQQRRLRAERQAEQREGMRQQIVVDLRVGLVPRLPARALPEDLVPRAYYAWWQRLWMAIRGLLSATVGRVVRLFLAPLRWVLRIVAQRRLSPRAVSQEFSGGIFGAWWITPDKTVWRKHWVILIQRIWQSMFAWSVVFLVFLLMVNGILPGSWWIGLILLFPVTGWVWWQYEDWANDIYIVTNEKLIDIERRPFGISESRREGTLDRVQNVSTEIPGFWPNLLNYGNVLIRTAALDEGFTFDKVADPRGVQREIWRRIAVYRANRAQRDAASQRAQQAQILGVYHELMEETGRYRPGPNP